MLKLENRMLTGIKLVDEQHAELFERINAVSAAGLSAAGKEETEKTINFLGDYIHKHFADEEKLQAQCGYPKYDWHKSQHKYYISEFESLRGEYKKNGASAAFTMKLNSSVVGWIVHHIQSVDVEFGKFYNEHKPA